MKHALLLSLCLFSLSSFAQSTINAKKDLCYSTIINIMRVVASETSKVMDIKVVLDTKYYNLERGAGKEERTYRVRLDNGYTYEYWNIDVVISDLIGPTHTCKVNKFGSSMM